MKKISNILVSGVLVLMGLFGLASVTELASPTAVYAANTEEVQDGINAVGGDETGNRAPAFTKLIQSIINILLFLIGAIAVIMIIIGGIRYVVSAGDQGQITGAKNTILYAVVGLVIAIMAYAIVNFFVNQLDK